MLNITIDALSDGKFSVVSRSIVSTSAVKTTDINVVLETIKDFLTRKLSKTDIVKTLTQEKR